MTDRIFVFDVDGTLCISRMEMDNSFREWFLNFQKEQDTYLITGSDREKTLEQVGTEVYNSALRVYNCSGNNVWEQDREVFSSKWKLPDDCYSWLERQMFMSSWTEYTGKHFEDRPGLCNFSVVGRNASRFQRQLYIEHDERTEERWTISEKFNDKFSEKYEIQSQVAGATGLDIMPIGKDKSQIKIDFPDKEMWFYGDKMKKGGNDYPLAEANTDGKNFEITHYQHTWRLLRDYSCND